MLKQAVLSFQCVFGLASVAFAAVETGHAAEVSSSGLPQFDPSWFPSQIFWLIVCFLVLYTFFSKKTLPEISNVIENRQNHIQADLKSAEKLTAEAEEVQRIYESSLEKARQEASKAILDVENSIKGKMAAEYEAFQKRSEQEIQSAEKRIVQNKNAALDEMNTVAAEVASEAVEKITGIGTDIQKAKTVVESLLGKARAA